jgi:HEAT repeat protein
MAAIKELKNFDDEVVIKEIINWMDLWGPSVGAAEASGQIGDRKQTVPMLIELLEHENADVRCAAAKSLGKIDDGQAVDALKKLKEDPVEQVRKAAQRALQNIKARQSKCMKERCWSAPVPLVSREKWLRFLNYRYSSGEGLCTRKKLEPG